MELTPEQRRQIYEEEKARLELEALTPKERRRIYEEEAEKNTAKEKRDPAETLTFAPATPASPLFIIIGVFILFGALYAIYMLSQMEASNRDAPNKASPSVAGMSSPSPSAVAQWDEAQARLATKDKEDEARVIVKDGWQFDIKDDYMYIRGSVKNNSPRTVGYWKATVNFYDKKGNIIDSAFTNALETLRPNAQKRFEIMHPFLSNLADLKISVEEVHFEN